jgi:hypothetical protein
LRVTSFRTLHPLLRITKQTRPLASMSHRVYVLRV